MIRYHVSFPDLQAHRVHVRMSLGGLDGGPLEIAMPVWSPGSYLVREYSRHVLDLSATSAAGAPLRTEKTAKNVWRIHADGATAVQIDYALYANEASVRTNNVDSSHAFLQSPGTFFRHAASERGAHRVTFDTPPGWTVFTALPRDGDGWLAADYDELADSPFELGPHQELAFEVRGVPHRLVLAGDSDVDHDTLRDDVARLCEEVASIFGQLPFDHYTFLLLLVDSGGGGLEHRFSSVCMANRWEIVKTDRYRRLLSLIAHEYFHAWNVKRFRPQALGPFDYDTENYTPDLWVAEGITSYYDELSTVRAGFTDKVESYLEQRAAAFRAEDERPGGRRTSLSASSFDAWIKLYRPDENSTNSTVSYYSKGALVALMLDLRIARLSDGARGLSDALRLGWERYAARDVGYPPGALRELASEVAGTDLTAFFEAYVQGTEPLDPDPELAWVGLRLAIEPEQTERPLTVDDEGFALQPWLGISTREANGLVRVDTVIEGGPAWKAGLNHDDLLLAIDDMRVSPATLADRLERTGGAEVALTFWRGQMLRVLRLRPELRRLAKWNLTAVDDPSEAQRAAFERWCAWEFPFDRADDGGGESAAADPAPAESQHPSEG